MENTRRKNVVLQSSDGATTHNRGQGGHLAREAARREGAEERQQEAECTVEELCKHARMDTELRRHKVGSMPLLRDLLRGRISRMPHRLVTG